MKEKMETTMCRDVWINYKGVMGMDEGFESGLIEKRPLHPSAASMICRPHKKVANKL